MSTARTLQRTGNFAAWRILQGDLYRAAAAESSNFDGARNPETIQSTRAPEALITLAHLSISDRM